MAGTTIVLGVGAADGVGAAIARRFAEHGHHVVLGGRTLDKVEARADEIRHTGGSAEGFAADVTAEADLDALFARVNQLRPLNAVVYNAGNNAVIPFEQLTGEQFEAFWRTGPYGAFLTAKRAIPMLAKQGSGSLFFTGASASRRGKPNYVHFSSAKAGLRMLAQALAREYGPKGIHVAHVVIDGAVNGEMVRTRFGDHLDKLGEDGTLSPDAIADAYWFLHSQPRPAWTHELDMRPFKENW